MALFGWEYYSSRHDNADNIHEAQSTSNSSQDGPSTGETLGEPNLDGSNSKSGLNSLDLGAIAVSSPGVFGIAVSDGTDVVSTGEFETGAAWSSSKVPVSIAALNADPSLASTAKSAIEESNNDAAIQLWQSLGSDAEAAQKTQEVLREGGDSDTTVNSVKTSEFTVFGQTKWSVRDQAIFASNLPSVQGSQQVLEYMSNIIPSQQWGLGNIPGTSFKGGWGPDLDDGKYLVRQLGLVTLSNGQTIGVAIAAKADDGSFDSGVAMLNELSAQLNEILM